MQELRWTGPGTSPPWAASRDCRMAEFIAWNRPDRGKVRSSDPRAARLAHSGGMVEKFLGMFSPFTAISRELQAMLQLERQPAFRAEHGRLEILLRGSGITEQPQDQRIAIARRVTDAARPLLRVISNRQRRRYAERAIAVVFEDETIVDGGIATSRFSYVASHDS